MGTLSLCMTASREPARVRAILALLRPLVDEIVLAADERGADGILGACADLVDRPLAYAFEWPPARYIAWIHHQCSADWILRLDDDELPGQDLLDALPALVEDRRHSCIWLPRRHLFPDLDRYLASHPWSPDYQARLVRNVPGLWRFDGRAHHAAEVLGEHRREPGAAVYHLRYACTTEERRVATVESFERALPGQMTEAYPVNALYLPERWSGVRTVGVPEPDRDLIAAVAVPARAPERPAPPHALAAVADVDRFNMSRPIGEDAYAAEIRILPARPALFAGALAYVETSVRNLGREHLPPAHQAAPLIRLAYRWLSADGAERVVPNGLRTPFEETVPPGQETVVMLAVAAPEAPGDYVLEVDVVHELVRWFGAAARMPVTVEPRDPAPPGSHLARPDLARIPQSFGLGGIDLALAEHLDGEPGFFVEAGANDGVQQSNTLLLERTRGWRGLLVEPVPELADRCRANRPDALVEQVALVPPGRGVGTIQMHFSGLMSLVRGAHDNPEAEAAHVVDGLARQGLAGSYEVDVPARTLSAVLDAHGIAAVDLLVLDVEGYEGPVLEGLDLGRHGPRYILVEERFPDQVAAVLGGAYERVAELSHHDVLYRRRESS